MAAIWPIAFTPGSKPGVKRTNENPKDTLTHTESYGEIKSKNRRKDYEQRRPDRTFQKNWQEGRPWLIFENDVMKCHTCIEYTKPPASTSDNQFKNKHLFIQGCRNFRLTTVTDHENSKMHINALRLKQAQEQPKEKSVALKALTQLNQHTVSDLILKFRNVHAIIKENRPMSDFVWINRLDKSKGLKHLDTYNNQKAVAPIVEVIADVERTKLRDMVENVNFFSLTMDGSTDDASIEQETIFVHTCHEGVVQDMFMSIGEPESTGSGDLYKYVNEQLTENSIDSYMTKCVGFASDGAANMVGKKTGLITRLKVQYPQIMGIKCLAHRLELSFRDGVKELKPYTRLMTMLLGLYYFYKRSPKQRKGLKETFKVMAVKGVLPKRVGGSRWMPHVKKALDAIYRSYPAYIAHLETLSHSNSKSEGLVRLMGSCDVVAFGMLLKDVLEPLTRMSLFLQKADITLGDVHMMIVSTVEVLRQYPTKISDDLNKILESGEFAGHKLSRKTSPDIRKMAQTLVDNISEAITNRFDDLQEDLKPTLIANKSNWPSEPTEDFGDAYVKALVTRFKETLDGAGVDLQAVGTEWTLLKSLTYNRYSGQFQTTTWRDMHTAFASYGVANIIKIIDLIRSLPATSVRNETAFNQMKLMKTDRRHRLSNAHLNDCMVIKLQSPEIEEYDPKPAIDRWMLAPVTGRKPEYKRSTLRKVLPFPMDTGNVTSANVGDDDNMPMSAVTEQEAYSQDNDDDVSQSESDDDDDADIDDDDEMSEKDVNLNLINN